MAGQAVTAESALREFGCRSLPARISELRRFGHPIAALKEGRRVRYELPPPEASADDSEPEPVFAGGNSPWRPVDLKAALFAHTRWLAGDQSAHSIDLRGANLSNVSLYRKDLRKANFSRANFEGADLRYANLEGANLSGCNLHRAKMRGCNLKDAILQRAFAAYVSFPKVNLQGADLSRADLTAANLDTAIFGEDYNSQLARARLQIVPDGDIIGWKKLRGGRIARLLIPASARRSNAFGRRCRAEKVKVISIETEDGRNVDAGYSKYDGSFIYRVNEEVKSATWDDRWWQDCAGGIHFFLSWHEAEAL